MAKPVVAVVGRPNVGKSTLFNKLIGQRLSIVDDTPGVTRDRIYGDCEWLGKTFLLVDTGGIEPYSDDIILSQMRRQAQLAIDSADVIILVTDVRSGVVATDEEVASMLQKSGKPIVLCVNKCDKVGEAPLEYYEFYNLGLGDPIQVSAVHGHGTGDLLNNDLLATYYVDTLSQALNRLTCVAYLCTVQVVNGSILSSNSDRRDTIRGCKLIRDWAEYVSFKIQEYYTNNALKLSSLWHILWKNNELVCKYNRCIN